LVNKEVVEEVVKEVVDCEKVDNWIWREGDSGRYTIKSAYVSLRRELHGEDSLIFEQFWKIKFIPSTHITNWRVLQKALTTKDNFSRHGVVLLNNLCVFCCVEKDSIIAKLLGLFGGCVIIGWGVND